MPSYPPADDRLKHLIAQEINLSVDTWKLAFWIADGIVKSPEIRAELERIVTAHHKGQHCGDRHCQACFNAQLTTAPAPARPVEETPVATTYLIEFGPIEGTRPVPPLTVTAADDDALCRAVTDHAIPHITSVLDELGRPELADCLFRLSPDRHAGHFEWLDLASGEGARFLGALITPTTTPAAARTIEETR